MNLGDFMALGMEEQRQILDAASRQSRSKALLAAAKDAMDILGEAPEINPCNYTHEEACEINAACTNAYQVLMDAIAAANSQ